ncbi:hypothetical protein BDD12DRAFT_892925 [Trichophaea hybrida]|nr:hypothetical protein BDD12DRAFT_892925 [Trichophaea hybrida]
MPSVEAITDKVCLGLEVQIWKSGCEHENAHGHALGGGLAGLLAAEMALDVWSHGLVGAFEGLLDGVLGSELHLEQKHTGAYCDRTRKAMTMSKIEDLEAWPVGLLGDESEANRPESDVTGQGGHPGDSEMCQGFKARSFNGYKYQAGGAVIAGTA